MVMISESYFSLLLFFFGTVLRWCHCGLGTIVTSSIFFGLATVGGFRLENWSAKIGILNKKRITLRKFDPKDPGSPNVRR